MAILRTNINRKSGGAGSLLRRYFVAAVCACLAAISALAQTGPDAVTVTLLPSYTHTQEVRGQGQGDKSLNVVASGVAGHPEAVSWLYFSASALPDGVTVTNVRLQLAPKAADDKVMTITVASRQARADGKEPLSYSASTGTVVTWVSGPKFDSTLVNQKIRIGAGECTVKAKTSPTSLTCREDLGKQLDVTADVPAGMKVNTYPDFKNRDTLRSAPLIGRTAEEKEEKIRERSDSASLMPGSLLQTDGGRKYIGLLLLPQGNASRRVYYGLDPSDVGANPGRRPRLIITYSRPAPAVPASACASEPSALAFRQSDGRLAESSPCTFIPTANNPAKSDYVPIPVAAGVLTTPVVYGDRLYVVREEGSETRLEERSALGGFITSISLGGKDTVRQGSPMVVDRFGRLRIITNTEIITAQLKTEPNLAKHLPPAVEIDKKDFAFDDLANLRLVPGPDGTLYIVKGLGIFALNPEVGELDPAGKKVLRPQKLWEVGIKDQDTARITLSPDGRFLYALARFADPENGAGKQSQFIAINAQTGRDVQLPSGKVDTEGNLVTWVSGLQFDATSEGEKISIGFADCTVKAKASPTSLTCEENLEKKSGIVWAAFPGNLNEFRNPVVATGLDGVDFVYLTGNSGSGATLWGVRNDPVTQDGNLVARLTAVWKYPLEKGSNVGQPVLDPTTRGLSEKKLYFFQRGAGGSRLTAVGALDGKKVPVTCTVEKIASPKSLTCQEDLGQQSGVWAYYSTARGLTQVNTSGNGVTWVAGLPLDATEVGQEISIGSHTCTVESIASPPKSLTCKEGLGKQEYVRGDVPFARVKTAGTVVTWVSGLQFDVTTVGQKILIGSTAAETILPAEIGTNATPVVDSAPVTNSAGNVIFWNRNTLYGFTADRQPLFALELSTLSKDSQLLFGPGGTLYAASGTTVSALVPSFEQSDAGPTSIYSPTHLYMTGSAARQGPKQWKLEARGSVILGRDFSVKTREELSVSVPGKTPSASVPAETPSVSVPGETPSVSANVNTSTSGTVVTWLSGLKFDKTEVGQQILIGSPKLGSHLCTVATKTSNTSLTCKENIGEMPAGSAFSNSPAVVKTDGTVVTYISGTRFHALFAVGDRNFYIGSRPCTLVTPLVSNYTLRCKEDQGKSDGILAYRVEGTVSASPP